MGSVAYEKNGLEWEEWEVRHMGKNGKCDIWEEWEVCVLEPVESRADHPLESLCEKET